VLISHRQKQERNKIIIVYLFSDAITFDISAVVNKSRLKIIQC